MPNCAYRTIKLQKNYLLGQIPIAMEKDHRSRIVFQWTQNIYSKFLSNIYHNGGNTTARQTLLCGRSRNYANTTKRYINSYMPLLLLQNCI